MNKQVITLGLILLSFISQAAERRRPAPSPVNTGTFWSMQRNMPPLPFNPYPDLPVYEFEKRQYLYDDRAVDYEAMSAQAFAMETVEPNAGQALMLMGGSGPALAISRNGQGQIEVQIVNAPAGSVYDLYQTDRLEGNALTAAHWQKVGSGSDGQIFTFPSQSASVFYLLGDQDTDQDLDGLADAYEVLVTKTSTSAPNCPKAVYEAAINAQSPDHWFKLNDTDVTPDAVSLADAGTGGGAPLGNSGAGTPAGAYSTNDLFDTAYGAVGFNENSDVLTAGDLINGGASVAPSVDQTALGSVSFLFRTLGALTANKRYLLSQGTSSTGSKNAFHLFFDNAAGGQGLKLQIGDKTTTTPILPASEIVPSAWYYMAITWKEDRDPEVVWYLGRVGGVINSDSIDIQDTTTHAVVGDNGPLFLGNKSGGGGAFQETIQTIPYNGRLDQVAFWNRELTEPEVRAQFNALPPAGLSAIFDLTRWNLMLPVNSAGGLGGTDPHVVEQSQLTAGFKYVDCTKKYFYRGDGNTMVFQVPSNGERDGQWPRSELRGTRADGEEDNWIPNSSTHTLKGTCRIMDHAVGKIVIGQIHAETDPDGNGSLKPLPAITLHVDYTSNPSFIEVAVYNTPTSSSPGHTLLRNNIALNTDINYELELVGTANSVMLQVTLIYNGVTTVQNVSMSASWLGNQLYFKAGCYYNNISTGDDAKVTFSKLSVTP